MLVNFLPCAGSIPPKPNQLAVHLDQNGVFCQYRQYDYIFRVKICNFRCVLGDVLAVLLIKSTLIVCYLCSTMAALGGEVC